MDDDLVTHSLVDDICADLVHDARTIRATNVERAAVIAPLVELDDVDRSARSGPQAVVVDAGRHDQHEALVPGDARHIHALDSICLQGVAESLLAYHLCIHLLRHHAQRRLHTDLTDVHASSAAISRRASVNEVQIW